MRWDYCEQCKNFKLFAFNVNNKMIHKEQCVYENSIFNANASSIIRDADLHNIDCPYLEEVK